jgi:hypothetical protein
MSALLPKAANKHVPRRIAHRAGDDLIWINPGLPFYASAQVEMLPALGRVFVPESSCHRGASLLVLTSRQALLAC